jgi:hypothetical protein
MAMMVVSAHEDPVPLVDVTLFGRRRRRHFPERMTVYWLALAARQSYRMIGMAMMLAGARKDPVPRVDVPLFGRRRHRHHLPERMPVYWLALTADWIRILE